MRGFAFFFLHAKCSRSERGGRGRIVTTVEINGGDRDRRLRFGSLLRCRLKTEKNSLFGSLWEFGARMQPFGQTVPKPGGEQREPHAFADKHSIGVRAFVSLCFCVCACAFVPASDSAFGAVGRSLVGRMQPGPPPRSRGIPFTDWGFVGKPGARRRPIPPVRGVLGFLAPAVPDGQEHQRHSLPFELLEENEGQVHYEHASVPAKIRGCILMGERMHASCQLM